MHLDTIWELNVIDLELQVHAFTLVIDTRTSVTYAKGIKHFEVKTSNFGCLALINYTLYYSRV